MLKTYSSAELSGVLFQHAQWLRGEAGGARANLSGANLSDANLSDANLSGATGVVPLPVGDPRGYRPVAFRHSDGWRIASGCRWFSVADARAHWGSAKYVGERWIADQYVRALDWLEAWDAFCGAGSSTR